MHGDDKERQKYPLCLLLHDMRVPMNVGSIFRVADALGVEKIYLCGNTPRPPNDKIRKTSRATEKYVPYVYTANVLALVQQLKAEQYRIVSLEITPDSTDIQHFAGSGDERICLILGSEKDGVSRALLEASDDIIHIPMLGWNASMNVATACAIAVFEITRKCYGPGQTAVERFRT